MDTEELTARESPFALIALKKNQEQKLKLEEQNVKTT